MYLYFLRFKNKDWLHVGSETFYQLYYNEGDAKALVLLVLTAAAADSSASSTEPSADINSIAFSPG